MADTPKPLAVSAEQAGAAFSTMYRIILAALEVQRWAEAAAIERQPQRTRLAAELPKAA